VDGHSVLVGNRKLMDESGVDVFRGCYELD
jgi:hypothetical protein